MPHKRRLIVTLGWAFALSTPFEAAMAQERQNRQNEPQANEAPQQQDDRKPKDDQGNAKRNEDGTPKGRENRPAPDKKKTQDEKPAPKSQTAPPPKAPTAPAAPKDAQEKVPPSTAPEKREPVEKDKAKSAPVDVQPAPVPKSEQPVVVPPKATTAPLPAPDTGQKAVPTKPEAAPAKPDGGINSGPKPVVPGEKSSAPQPPAAVPAPTMAAPAAPPTPAQQATPQKPAVLNAPAAALPVAPVNPAAPAAFQPGFQPAGAAPQKLQDIQKGRVERVEDGGKRTVIQEVDNRVIIKQDNRTIIRHDETQRFAKNATNVKSERRADGTTVTIIVQPGGIQIFNIVDNSGRTVRRYRRDDRGREVDIIDNRSFYKSGAVLGVGLVVGAVALALRPPEIRIPREKYVVDYERASDEDIYETLTAPPVEKLERRYSLEEVRFSHELRERMRRLDLDTVTFEFGSWEVSAAQFSKLERVAKVMDRVLQNKPDEVFLVEGHTDAVGSDVDNLTLSDRRAQSVAEILTGVFRVPAENLVTQGYGEQYLKVPAQGAEQANRRVAIRRITPLMADNK
ncbi:MAG: OmpA family protein [Hyphomicrobiaceae bacterium]